MLENPKHLVNRAMHETVDEPEQELPYLCECGDEHCFASIWLSAADFEAFSLVGASILAGGHRPFVPELEPAIAA